MSDNRLTKILLVILLCLFYGLFLSHKINLVTADLGRHLVNGQVFWEKGQILKTNTYSYTETDYPVLNHHWLSGVIFYKIWQIGGFSGLQLFYILLSTAALGLMLWWAYGSGNLLITTLLALPVINLLAERTEIRPEVFTYFFVSVFWLILTKFKDNQKTKWIWLLPVLQIVWVNTHIYFFLGPGLIGCFLLGKRRFKLLTVFIVDCLAIMVNPYGVKGLLAPLTIFNNYGYRLAENQPVWMIEKILSNPHYLVFKIVFLLLVASFIFVFIKQRKVAVTNLLVAVAISAAGWLAIRNFALFGLLTLPIMAVNWSGIAKNSQNQSFLGVTAVAVGIVVYSLTHQFGLGLEVNNQKAAEFFIKENLSGPIFNNYDIGSYLIYYFYPQEKVFVDNRPEAYTADFFTKVYVPMQEDDQVWQKQLEKYQFQAIIFSIKDFTPWGQQFLIQRVKDPEWAPVYADQRVIIFLKRNEKNAPVISQFELLKERFRISGPGGN
ncbi:MAG: hypothetical protein NTZ93_04495 [Candidatus Beckwithbacteria bacterium]|nr:hypothetical protein [Candidatus Beckwithbacteria bacterium]